MANLSIKIAFVLFFVPSLLCAQISFKSKSYQAAKETALVNDKAFFAYFSGTWCANCHVMEETTFQSQAVAMAVKDKYETYKVDFDNPQASDWKDEFEICCLPSVLIFDENAQLLNKIEQPLTSTRLVELLNDPLHFDPDAIKTQTENLTAPIAASFPVSEFPKEKSITTSPIREEPVKAEAVNTNFRIVIRKAGTSFESVANKITSSKEPKQKLLSSINEMNHFSDSKLLKNEIKNSNIEKTQKANYQVQAGYFKHLDNAMKLSQRIKSEYNLAVMISEDYKDSKVNYRVLVGNYHTMNEAKKQFKKMKNRGQRASIRKI